MDEETQPKETTTNDSNSGDEPKANTLIDDTNLAAKRTEEATKALKDQLDRQEELFVQNRLSGRAEGGSQPIPKETEDEKWAREAKIRYAGTGMDPTE